MIGSIVVLYSRKCLPLLSLYWLW